MKALKIVIPALILALVLSGCSAFSLVNRQSGLEPINPHKNPEEVTVVLYFGDDQAMHVVAEQRTVEQGDETLPSLLIKELIAGPRTEGLHKTLPAETKLLGVEIKDGIAYVDFSQEVASKHWGGSAGEAMTIASVVNTLTELEEIEAVQFLVEGKIHEAIWGHATTSEPIARQDGLIKK